MTARDALDRRGQARIRRRWPPTIESAGGHGPSGSSVGAADPVDVEPPAIVELSGPSAVRGPGDRRTIALVAVAAVLVATAVAGRLVAGDARMAQSPPDSGTGPLIPTATPNTGMTPAAASVRSPVAGTTVRGPSVHVVLDGGSTTTLVDVIVAAGATELGKVRVDLQGGVTEAADVVIGSLPFAIDGTLRVAPVAAGSRPVVVLPVRLEPEPWVVLTGIDIVAGGDRPRLEIDGLAAVDLERLHFRLDVAGGAIGGAPWSSDQPRTVASGQVRLGAAVVGWGGILLAEQPFRWLTDIDPLMPGTRALLEISWTDPRTGRAASISRILVAPRRSPAAGAAGGLPGTIGPGRSKATSPAAEV